MNNTSISTGLALLDDALGGGLRPGTLTVIAGRTGMGATSLALQIGESITKITRKKGWLYTGGSVELNPADVLGNLLYHRDSGVRIPFTDCDSPHLSAALIERKLTGADVSCVVIDQLLTLAANQPERYDCFSTALPAVARELKHLARTLCVPVICTGTLHREEKTRHDLCATVADFQADLPLGGAVDTALLLWREAYCGLDERKRSDRAEITVVQRHGGAGLVRCRWDKFFLRFEERT